MTFHALSEGEYLAAVPEHQTEFRARRLRDERHEVHGELDVTCGLLGVRAFNEDGLISSASMNFSSETARTSRAKGLAERARTNGKIDWNGYLQEFCTRVLHAFGRGEPAVILSQVQTDPDERTVVVDGIPLYLDHPQVDFGDGGTAKSLLQLYRAGLLTQQGLRVLFVDWELTKDTHRRRLGQLFGTDLPGVRYIRCDRPLVHEVDRLRREITTHDIQFGIFDSVGFGCAGPPEAAEAALGYFRAARQLRIGGVHVAHISKAENGDQRPFGSAYWHNSARATWFVKAADSSPNLLSIGLINRKMNVGPPLGTRAYTFDFSPGRIDVQSVAAGSFEELAGTLPMWQRIRDSVQSGPKTYATLAEELNAKVDSIEKAVKRKDRLFTRITRNGIAHVALLEGRSA